MNPNLFVRQGTAMALGGHLHGPVPRIIEPQACLSVAGVGSSGTVAAKSFSCNGISFERAETQIEGVPTGPEETTAITMIRTSIRGLNVMNVITAKAVHACLVVTTDIPSSRVQGLGSFSKFNFRGTAFEDLRVAGASFGPSRDSAIPRISETEGSHPFDRLLRDLRNSFEANRARLVRPLIQDERTSTPVRIPDFGQVYIAELQYNPFLSCLNMLRVEVNCGALRGHFEIAAVRGGGSCWPRQ